ncbi:MAG: SH3 domain-containing protein, partial [Oscillospiraceae bacterium]|nr:SH3 domain-containing protein [Oscillospiraceae bacterium]
MSKTKKIYTVTLIILMLSAGTVLGTAGYVNFTGVRMRANPGTDAEIITTLQSGERVEILGTTGEWHRIRFDEQVGYMFSNYIDISEGLAPESEEQTSEPEAEQPTQEGEETFPQTATTNSVTNVHIIPSITSSITLEIRAGRIVTIQRRINNWLYIAYGNQSGWIRQNAVEASTENVPQDTDTDTTGVTDTTNNIPLTGENIRFVYGSSANVRQAPNTASEVVAELRQGDRVRVIRLENYWYRVEFSG